MKRCLISLLALILVSTSSLTLAAPSQLTGGGSSFIDPVMEKWIIDCGQKNGIDINYQSIGSGAGTTQLKAGTLTFAASDEPLKNDQLQKNDWLQFPAITGGIVVIVHINGVSNNQLALDGKTLADIYLGKIKYWDNAAIKVLNPGLKLPHKGIIAIHRADGSGTTFNYTNYLAKVSPVWKKTIGVGTVVSWPGGVGAKGNAGVASQVQTLNNSIGYVEYTYAQENGLTVTKMKNCDGQVVTASLTSFESAAANANWQASNSFYQVLTCQPGDDSWPIVATTFIMIPKKTSIENKATLFKFFSCIYKHSSDDAKQLNYVGIPSAVNKTIMARWKSDN